MGKLEFCILNIYSFAERIRNVTNSIEMMHDGRSDKAQHDELTSATLLVNEYMQEVSSQKAKFSIEQLNEYELEIKNCDISYLDKALESYSEQQKKRQLYDEQQYLTMHQSCNKKLRKEAIEISKIERLKRRNLITNQLFTDLNKQNCFNSSNTILSRNSEKPEYFWKSKFHNNKEIMLMRLIYDIINCNFETDIIVKQKLPKISFNWSKNVVYLEISKKGNINIDKRGVICYTKSDKSSHTIGNADFKQILHNKVDRVNKRNADKYIYDTDKKSEDTTKKSKRNKSHPVFESYISDLKNTKIKINNIQELGKMEKDLSKNNKSSEITKKININVSSGISRPKPIQIKDLSSGSLFLCDQNSKTVETLTKTTKDKLLINKIDSGNKLTRSTSQNRESKLAHSTSQNSKSKLARSTSQNSESKLARSTVQNSESKLARSTSQNSESKLARSTSQKSESKLARSTSQNSESKLAHSTSQNSESKLARSTSQKSKSKKVTKKSINRIKNHKDSVGKKSPTKKRKSIKSIIKKHKQPKVIDKCTKVSMLSTNRMKSKVLPFRFMVDKRIGNILIYDTNPIRKHSSLQDIFIRSRKRNDSFRYLQNAIKKVKRQKLLFKRQHRKIENATDPSLLKFIAQPHETSTNKISPEPIEIDPQIDSEYLSGCINTCGKSTFGKSKRISADKTIAVKSNTDAVSINEPPKTPTQHSDYYVASSSSKPSSTVGNQSPALIIDDISNCDKNIQDEKRQSFMELRETWDNLLLKAELKLKIYEQSKNASKKSKKQENRMRTTQQLVTQIRERLQKLDLKQEVNN